MICKACRKGRLKSGAQQQWDARRIRSAEIWGGMLRVMAPLYSMTTRSQGQKQQDWLVLTSTSWSVLRSRTKSWSHMTSSMQASGGRGRDVLHCVHLHVPVCTILCPLQCKGERAGKS